MMSQWPSPAKLNLFLYITGRRDDNYHNLQTLFQFLDYSDTLTITPRADSHIKLLTPLKGVAEPDNLIIRAARLLKQQTGHQGGADISIKKILPMGGGLGGGSSNAATVLVALNHLWGTQLNNEELAKLGLILGADVPIFIFGHAAFAEGVGDKLQAVNPPEKWYLVANPGVHIPTALIFNDVELPRNTTERPLNELLNLPFSNDCEPIVRKRFYQVEQLISWLLEYAPSRLTGTGSCVFAEFDTEQSARQVLDKAPEWLVGFVARGVNVSPLQQTLMGSS